jgi:phosphoglycerate-specific signal transduction histidine kinase
MRSVKVLLKRALIYVVNVQLAVLHFLSNCLGSINDFGSAAVREGEIQKLVIVIRCSLLHIRDKLLQTLRQKIHSAYDFDVNSVSVCALVSQEFTELFRSNPHDLLNFACGAPEILSGKSV